MSLTAGQIGKVQRLLSTGLREANLPSKPVDLVLAAQGDSLVSEFIEMVCRRVQAITGMLIRHVTVDRTRSPLQGLEAKGWKLRVDAAVVKTMPNGSGEQVDVYFFQVDCRKSDEDLGKEFKYRGLIPVDPFTLAAVNEADPEFAYTHQNATHWQDADGSWCYAVFYCWNLKVVRVGRHKDDWHEGWWFAGVCE